MFHNNNLERVEKKNCNQTTYLIEIAAIFNVGIKHGFSCIDIRQVPWEVLKTEAGGRGFQHLPRDLANVIIFIMLLYYLYMLYYCIKTENICHISR